MYLLIFIENEFINLNNKIMIINLKESIVISNKY